MAADPDLFVSAMSQAMLDVRRTLDLLASRPEVDPRRLGITGISLGGIVAATAAGGDPRISRAVLLLSGGDLVRIVHHARETDELSATIKGLSPAERARVEKALRAVDPLTFAAALRDRARQGKVLMINAAEDEVIPRACTQSLADALGIGQQVIWYEGLGHYTAMAALPRAMQTTADFFARDLPEGVRREQPAVPIATPQRRVVSVLNQLGGLLVAAPKAGKCHFVDLQLAATLPDGQAIDGELRLIRGSGHQFSLRCRAPVVGEVALGQGQYPWLASGKRVVFQGVLAADVSPRDPLAFADERYVMSLRMVSGLLGALVLAPDMLDRWVIAEAFTDGTGDANDAPAIRLTRRDNRDDQISIGFQADGVTPRVARFRIEGVRGTVTFRAWQFDTVAPAALFDPPSELPAQQVGAADLYRMFSALFNFAMESLE
jgi:dienelactone hydrolase